jgi:hypothetical protein
MLFLICLGIFLVSLSALVLLLYFYRNEVAEDGFLFFKSKEEPIREMGVKGTILGNKVSTDEATKQRLMHASTLKSSREKDSDARKNKAKSVKQGDVHMSVVRDSIEMLNEYLWECKNRLKHFDGATIEPNAITSKNTADQVIFARKMVQSLQKKVDFVTIELESGAPDYQKIYKEITAPVSFLKDTFHSLISSEETPPVKWDDLGMVIKKITSDLDIAIRDRKKVVR